MSNEELERIMNFIIVRQERLAERDEQFAEQMAQQQALMKEQQAFNAQMQRVIDSVIETQQRNTVDIANLAAVVDRIIEAMPRSDNGHQQ